MKDRVKRFRRVTACASAGAMLLGGLGTGCAPPLSICVYRTRTFYENGE